MAGTSYRPPTFDDLFWPATGMAVGNPDLRPERASDWDVGVDLRPRRFLPRVSIDAYGRDVRNLIAWNPGPSGIWRPSNVGRADVRGVEASLVWNEAEGGSLPRVEITATLQRARDRSGEPNTDGRDLPGRPRRLFAARIEKAFGPRVRIETAWRAVGDVPRTAANTKSIPGYAIGSVGARVVALSWLTASAGVDNVGDVAYEDFHDFPLPGRVFRVAFAFRRAEGEPAGAGSEAGE
jgi:outer membrane receptor protein involved in Fe transport